MRLRDDSTSDDEPTETAALYLAGALGPGEGAAFEARLDADPAARDALEALWPALDALADAPPAEPSPAVRAALLGMAAQASGGPGPPIDGARSTVVGEADAPWLPTSSRGVTARRLHADPETGVETLLLRMEPGAILKAHPHGPGGEECFLIEGDAFSAGVVLKAGDFQRLPPGHHGPVASRGGCLALIRISRR